MPFLFRKKQIGCNYPICMSLNYEGLAIATIMALHSSAKATAAAAPIPWDEPVINIFFLISFQSPLDTP